MQVGGELCNGAHHSHMGNFTTPYCEIINASLGRCSCRAMHVSRHQSKLTSAVLRSAKTSSSDENTELPGGSWSARAEIAVQPAIIEASCTRKRAQTAVAMHALMPFVDLAVMIGLHFNVRSLCVCLLCFANRANGVVSMTQSSCMLHLESGDLHSCQTGSYRSTASQTIGQGTHMVSCGKRQPTSPTLTTKSQYDTTCRNGKLSLQARMQFDIPRTKERWLCHANRRCPSCRLAPIYCKPSLRRVPVKLAVNLSVSMRTHYECPARFLKATCAFLWATRSP